MDLFVIDVVRDEGPEVFPLRTACDDGIVSSRSDTSSRVSMVAMVCVISSRIASRTVSAIFTSRLGHWTPTTLTRLRRSRRFCRVVATSKPSTRGGSLDALASYRVAHTSAAMTRGSLQRALRVARKMTTSWNPASRNSSRKAPPSFAPAIQANHSASVNSVGFATASRKTSSAAKTHPPGRTTRASSRNI